MKKRLRKKIHVDEFALLGRMLLITLKSKEGLDDFLNGFMDIVDENECDCSGSISDDTLEMILELGGPADDREGRLKRITGWLEGRSEVKSWKALNEFDICYGPADEATEQIVRGGK